MTMIAALPDRVTLEPAASLFHGFADPARLSILQLLMRGEKKVVDLTEHLGLAQSTVSQHLACLRECGLVTVRSEARSSLYSIAHPELIDLLRSAEQLLAATGAQVMLCENYGARARA